MKYNSDAAVLFFVFVALVIIFSPLVTIWALNTLFPSLAIPYTIDTWGAVVLLIGVGKTTISKRD